MTFDKEQSSFRDSDGYVFYAGGEVYRAISPGYKATWEALIRADFFNSLLRDKKLPNYSEVSSEDVVKNDLTVYKVLKVEKIPFISYPSEWSFEQLKKAALLTLSIQKQALLQGFSLKDASAFNVQFRGPKAVFIDLLSFDIYEEGKPWVAYGQFCRHFLGPLLLLSYGREGLQSLFVSHIDGLPLKLVSGLLPARSRFNLLAYTHIHLHARFEDRHSENTRVKQGALKISKARTLAILEHLEQGIRKLSLKKSRTNWTDYYSNFSYTNEGYEAKKAFVEKHMARTKPGLCIDLGANTGEFSEIASRYSTNVVAFDNDVEVVRAIQTKKTPNILALVADLSNPTPAHGWNGRERKALNERLQNADVVMALALIHHLCIGNNVPLGELANFFAGFSNKLIIEFVPKDDEQVKKLLVTRKDIFGGYTYDNFVKSFSAFFQVEDTQPIPGSGRVILFLRRQ
jgi:hypothetical protein